MHARVVDTELWGRDLKSPNLLVMEDYTVKVADYGASRIFSHRMSVGIGTLHWMAPEVIDGKHYSMSADIYSIGVVLYEMFARAHPFDDIHPHMVPSLVTQGKRPELPKNLPKSLAKLIRDCWHERPKTRPPAARVLSTLLSLRGTEWEQ